jgi:hypothetical protein
MLDEDLVKVPVEEQELSGYRLPGHKNEEM